LGLKNPVLTVAAFFLWIFIFATSGGFAGLAYGDIIGKTVPAGIRGKLYAGRELAGSVAALGGSLIVSQVFSPGQLEFPLNYTVLFLIGCGGLILASGGFWFIDEPMSPVVPDYKRSLGALIREVPNRLKADREFSRFILVENLTSFSLMVLPFYMIFAKEVLEVNQSYVGRYLIFSVVGTITSNFIWGMIAQGKGSKAVVRSCILLGSLIPLLALFLALLGPGWFGVVFLLVGFIQSGREVGFEPYLLDIAPEEKRTVYLGIRGTLNLLVVLMPILGGFFIDVFGFYITFALVAVVMTPSAATREAFLSALARPCLRMSSAAASMSRG
jgi:MFS family permease